MRTGKIHTYVNGRDISNRKGVTIRKTTDKVSYRVVTDNDLWCQVWFTKKEDAETYIKFYVENNVKKSRDGYRNSQGLLNIGGHNWILFKFSIDRKLYKNRKQLS
jgi:hypothetical protein